MGVFDTDFGVLPASSASNEQGTLWDSFTTAFEVNSKVDSFLGVEAMISKQLNKTVADYKARTGEDPGFNPNDGRLIYQFTRNTLYPEGNSAKDYYFFGGRGADNIAPGGGQTQAEFDMQLAKLAEFEDKVRALNDPSLPNMDQIISRVGVERADLREAAANAEANGGWGSGFMRFAGGVAGSFTTKDPLQLLTLQAGGFGKTVAARLLTEAAVGGGTEYIQQKTAIQPAQRAFDEEVQSPLLPVIYSALGSAAFRGVFEGGIVAGRRLRGPDEVPLELNFDDPQLRSMFQAGSPRLRAVDALAEDNGLFALHNPYPDVPDAGRAFTQDVADISSILSGRTDTSIVHFLPETHYELGDLSYDTLLVKEKAPEVYDAWEASKARLAEIDSRIADAEQGVAAVSVGDAVARIDEPTGELVRSYEADLKNPQLTAAQRAQTEARLNTIIESLGPERIARELNDAQISPREQLKSLRKARKSAVSSYNQARRGLDAAMVDVRAAEPAPVPISAPSPLPSGPYAFRAGDLAHTNIAASVRAVDDLEPRLPEIGEGIVRGNTELPEPEPQGALAKAAAAVGLGKKVPAKPATYDLGNGVSVPHDFAIEVHDFDGTVRTLTARDIFDDLKGDADMIEAMKGCAV